MKGYTLIEILITMTILAAVAAVGSISLFNHYSYQNLNISANEIVATLRQAQGNSLTQQNGEQWGVHFLNATTTQGLFQLFRGSDFASSTLVSSQELPIGIQFIDPVSGTSEDVVFSKITGYPDAPISIVVGFKNNPNVSSTIVINAIGRVSKF